MYTDEDDVISGYNLVKTAISINYPSIRIHGVKIPFSDVTTEEETFEFMKIAVKTIKNEKEKHNCEKVYLNTSGGRKNMGIAVSTIGQIAGLDGIFHVVSEDVKIVNQQLEALREDIRKFRDAVDYEMEDMYQKKSREFNSLLFPDPSSFEIIRIPVLPYPKSYFFKLVTNLKSNIESLSNEEKRLLWGCGVLDKTGTRYYLSDYGEKFFNVLMGR
jgi:CRISPR-associated protein Csx14